MKIKMVVTALLLSLSITAAAQLKTIAESYEVSMTDVRLPSTEVGTIAFKRCGDCSYETRRVTRETVYEFNGKRLPLDKFRVSFNSVDRSLNIPVQVVHHLESNQVTKVFIVAPAIVLNDPWPRASARPVSAAWNAFS